MAFRPVYGCEVRRAALSQRQNEQRRSPLRVPDDAPGGVHCSYLEVRQRHYPSAVQVQHFVELRCELVPAVKAVHAPHGWDGRSPQRTRNGRSLERAGCRCWHYRRFVGSSDRTRQRSGSVIRQPRAYLSANALFCLAAYRLEQFGSEFRHHSQRTAPLALQIPFSDESMLTRAFGLLL